MRSKWIFAVVGCLAGLAVCSAARAQDADPRAEAVQKAEDSPINFWGKVVDQDGNPVAGATATIKVDAKMWQEDESPKINILTDAQGCFSLTGKTGLGISAWVSKDGYYSDPDSCGVSLNYFLGPGSNKPGSFLRAGKTYEPFPTAYQPTVFVLTKRGQPANLIVKHVRLPMPKDGTPVTIDLGMGRVTTQGGDLRVESWVTDNGKDVVHPFPWKCRVTVLTGGLQPRPGQMSFQAPQAGYQSQEEVEMTKVSVPWTKDMMREYFLHVSGDRYVRMRFWMVCGGSNFLNLDYYLNPNPGDRNLESAKENLVF